MTPRQIEFIKRRYPSGTTVELKNMDDQYAPPVGTKGTVTFVDDLGTIHVNWENGSTLGVVLECGDRVSTVMGE